MEKCLIHRLLQFPIQFSAFHFSIEYVCQLKQKLRLKNVCWTANEDMLCFGKTVLINSCVAFRFSPSGFLLVSYWPLET